MISGDLRASPASFSVISARSSAKQMFRPAGVKRRPLCFCLLRWRCFFLSGCIVFCAYQHVAGVSLCCWLLCCCMDVLPVLHAEWECHFAEHLKVSHFISKERHSNTNLTCHHHFWIGFFMICNGSSWQLSCVLLFSIAFDAFAVK